METVNTLLLWNGSAVASSSEGTRDSRGPATAGEYLTDQIYIGVFAETYVEYELEVTVEYHPTQN